MNKGILTTIIAGQVAGYVKQHESGQLTFEYLPDYHGAPLSISMPVDNRTYGDKHYMTLLDPGCFERQAQRPVRPIAARSIEGELHVTRRAR